MQIITPEKPSAIGYLVSGLVKPSAVAAMPGRAFDRLDEIAEFGKNNLVWTAIQISCEFGGSAQAPSQALFHCVRVPLDALWKERLIKTFANSDDPKIQTESRARCQQTRYTNALSVCEGFSVSQFGIEQAGARVGKVLRLPRQFPDGELDHYVLGTSDRTIPPGPFPQIYFLESENSYFGLCRSAAFVRELRAAVFFGGWYYGGLRLGGSAGTQMLRVVKTRSKPRPKNFSAAQAVF